MLKIDMLFIHLFIQKQGVRVSIIHRLGSKNRYVKLGFLNQIVGGLYNRRLQVDSRDMKQIEDRISYFLPFILVR